VTSWAALLRGVNVGGHRRVPMADWRRSLERHGCADVRTYLQSGNAVFAHDGDRDEVRALVRAGLAEDLGVDCEVVLRTAGELAAVVVRNPWPGRVDEPTKLNVGFLSEPGEGSASRTSEHEEVRYDGAEVWIWFGDGAGRSRLSLDVGDRVVTVRNWRSVTALAVLAAAVTA
jgi:uncharacterized protein (DUF1697 family)